MVYALIFSLGFIAGALLSYYFSARVIDELEAEKNSLREDYMKFMNGMDK